MPEQMRASATSRPPLARSNVTAGRKEQFQSLGEKMSGASTSKVLVSVLACVCQSASLNPFAPQQMTLHELIGRGKTQPAVKRLSVEGSPTAPVRKQSAMFLKVNTCSVVGFLCLVSRQHSPCSVTWMLMRLVLLSAVVVVD
jgi:hypothetical protein